MPSNYVPIFLFIAVVAVMIPLPLILAKLVRPDNPGKEKLMPYECGIDPIDNSRGPYTVRYYIVVNRLRVSRVKSRLFGSTEESISIPQVASVKITTGMMWSDIIIDSSGGSDPITSHGHRKADALRIRDLVETYQVDAKRQ